MEPEHTPHAPVYGETMPLTLVRTIECGTGQIHITNRGASFAGDVPLEKTEHVLREMGKAAQTARFVIGDAILEHEKRTGKLDYMRLSEITGVEVSELADMRHVCYKVEQKARHQQLAFEFHHTVAGLDFTGQQKWLSLAEHEKLDRRRLRKSILAGHVVTEAEIAPNPADAGRDNPIPHINRICVLYSAFEKDGALDAKGPDELADIHRELNRVAAIHAGIIKRILRHPECTPELAGVVKQEIRATWG